MTVPHPVTHHDVVVVGARCAGAATAMLLARAGYDVALVDRAALPQDTTSTHSLVRGGVVQLARWGLLQEVLDSGAPPIRSVWFHEYGPQAPDPVRRTVKDRAGVDLLLAPRRHILDRILADAAVRAGATLLTRTTATGVLRGAGGRVVGVSARDARSDQRELTARLVVGADGVHSRLAGWVGASTVASYAASGACLYTYVDDVPWDGIEFHLADEAFGGVFPTHHGQGCVWLIRPATAFAPVLRAGAGRADAWLRALRETVPGLADRVLPDSISAPVRGAVGLPNHLRQAAGPGWALVGDAGYHRDPITGHGITDAFRDAALLADAAGHFLGEPGPGRRDDPAREAAAMAGYQTERDAAVADTFRVTRALGEFPRASRFLELQGELSRAIEVEASHLAERTVRVGGVVPAA